MNNYFAVSFQEHKNSLWIFHLWNTRRAPALTLREEYSQLTCPQCELFDPRAAVELGLSREIKVPGPLRNRDIILSGDKRVVVSKKSRQVLEGVPGLQADFFPLPGDKTFFVMLPVEKFIASKKVVVDGDMMTDVLRAEGPRCKKCKRYPFMMISIELVQVKSKAPLGAVELEGGPIQGSRDSWFATEDVVVAVKKAKLKGWIFYDLSSMKAV